MTDTGTRVDDAAWNFERERIDAITKLPHEDDVSVRGERDDVHPVRDAHDRRMARDGVTFPDSGGQTRSPGGISHSGMVTLAPCDGNAVYATARLTFLSESPHPLTYW